MVDNSQSQNPSIQRIHGIPCWPGTTREMIEALPRLVPRENDIFIVSYPKAGKVIYNTLNCTYVSSKFVPVASRAPLHLQVHVPVYSF